jgi:V8-like Glu-specific endopeptidase
MKVLLLLLCVSFSISAYAIYEEDNRQDLYEITNPQVKKVAAAMAYQIEKIELTGWTFERFWKLVMETMVQRGVCEEEKFSGQLSLRNNCTAILVSPKHLLSAGNCINEHFCTNDLYYWMFEHDLKTEGTQLVTNSRKNFYRCKKVVKRAFDRNSGVSYILFELEKEVRDVEPVKFRRSGNMVANEEVIVLGHPQGLPLKIADHAQVLDQNETHFILNSDIPGSNRGAAIINAKSYELEGIMVYGTANYESSGDACKKSPLFRNEEGQELALKTSVFKDILKGL